METSQYLELFIEESREHLQTCNEQLLELEKQPGNLSIVNDIFRAAHTIKGMSATMGYSDIADLTHKMENVLDAIRNEKAGVTPEVLDVVLTAIDQLESMTEDIAAGGTGTLDVSETVRQLAKIEAGDQASPSAGSSGEFRSALVYDEYEFMVLEQAAAAQMSSFEITVELQDDCQLKAARAFMVFEALSSLGEVIKTDPSTEELEDGEFGNRFQAVLVTSGKAGEVKQAVLSVSEVKDADIQAVTAGQVKGRASAEPKKQLKSGTGSTADEHSDEQPSRQKVSNKTIRVSIDRLDHLMNLFEELVIDRGRLQSLSRDLNNQALTETVEHMSRISGDLQSVILNMRMVPVDTVFNRFPKMVRQLSRDLGKQIRLEITGAETELDRTVIDEIGDPLVHLIRNAIDHGIETPEIRNRSGKPEEGILKLRAYHSGNNVFIEIEDDGAGISKDRVLDKAVENGVVTRDQAQNLEDREVYELIMASGFSTAETISDISGRGVGLDVVKTTIEGLGGSITIDSEEGTGSVFSVRLPLTLSIIPVMLVRLGNEVYAVPISSITETMLIQDEDILMVHDRQMIDYRGRVIPLISLHQVFGAHESENRTAQAVLIVQKGSKAAALSVDSFIGQQEVVLKPLGNYLTDVHAISGATILGDGKVALIVDSASLIQ
ncbi:chemotaxis protein CheA [Indiicoccus explosivorum]|uniref:chemotaxis protein CheA n=1 Tax=Indiicoccus explosivorum TaxID=1917864 RepID=UPI000B433FE2|nr:chemotaxis protein CheA [Indiicoccus explosivorum]